MAPTGMAAAADAPTGMAAAGWAAGAAGLAASESASDGAASATFRALAWSQDDSPGGEPVPYSGEDYTFDQGPTDARPQVAFAHEEEGYEPEPGPLPWYKRPPILFGAAAAAVLLAIGGLAITLTSGSGSSGPVTETATHVETGPSPGQPPTSQAPQTITVTGPNGEPSTTVVPPPPPPSHDHHVADDDHDHDHHHNDDHDHHHDDNDHDDTPPTTTTTRPPPRPLSRRRRPAGDHHHGRCAAAGDDDSAVTHGETGVRTADRHPAGRARRRGVAARRADRPSQGPGVRRHRHR